MLNEGQEIDDADMFEWGSVGNFTDSDEFSDEEAKALIWVKK